MACRVVRCLSLAIGLLRFATLGVGTALIADGSSVLLAPVLNTALLCAPSRAGVVRGLLGLYE